MNTEFLTFLETNNEEHNHGILVRAAQVIRRGGLVAFPTETVYGLGANALDSKAVQKVYAVKGRPSDNPLIMHIHSADELELCAREIPETARILADKFWPGPLTMVLPKNKAIPSEATGGRDTAAIRCPAHKIARELIREAGVPIAAPSANISGRPSPTDAAHVKQDLFGAIDMIIDGGACNVGIESTIINLARDKPVLLRPGFVTQGMIEEALNRKIQRSPLVTEAEAPGMKYKHYAPKAKVVVLKGSAEETVRYVCGLAPEQTAQYGVFASDESAHLYANVLVIKAGSRKEPEAVARGLFAALRRFDEHGVDAVFCEAFYDTELGQSVMNRLEKAAGYDIIEL